MGFDIKNTITIVRNTTTAIVRTLPQVMPEKLPSDQLWRFTMLESSANVTTKSVMAVRQGLNSSSAWEPIRRFQVSHTCKNFLHSFFNTRITRQGLLFFNQIKQVAKRIANIRLTLITAKSATEDRNTILWRCFRFIYFLLCQNQPT